MSADFRLNRYGRSAEVMLGLLVHWNYTKSISLDIWRQFAQLCLRLHGTEKCHGITKKSRSIGSIVKEKYEASR